MSRCNILGFVITELEIINTKSTFFESRLSSFKHGIMDLKFYYFTVRFHFEEHNPNKFDIMHENDHKRHD